MLFYLDLVIHQCKEEFSDEVNNFNSTDSPHFTNIYSENEETLTIIVMEIEKVWEMRYANGKMKTNP